MIPDTTDAERRRINRDKVYDLLRGGWRGTGTELGRLVGCVESAAGARCRDLRKPQYGGYDVPCVHVGGGRHEYYMRLDDDGNPMRNKPKPKKQIEGLKCWAVRADAGRRSIIVSKKPPMRGHSMWLCNAGSETVISEPDDSTVIIFNAIFPPSIQPGECVQVVIPMAVIVEGE